MSPLQQYAEYHSQLGGGFSLTDPTTWADVPGNAVKFTAAALGSGLNSFYNTGVAVGNFFGADWQERDTTAWLASYDQNLANYYEENKGAADLAGFIAGSLIPGTGAVKLVNYGSKALKLVETGAAGANASMHTGIFGSRVAGLTKAAIDEYKASGAMFSALDTKFLKAAAAGFGQDILEAGVYEIATQITMHKSPILDDQDLGDAMWNTAVGTVTGGVFSNVFRTAGLVGQMKKGVKDIDEAFAPLHYRTMPIDTAPADVRLGMALRDKAQIAKFDLESLGAGANRGKSLQDSSIKSANVDIRNMVHEIIPEDRAVANYWADRLVGATTEDAAFQSLNTVRAGRIGDAIPTFDEYMTGLQKYAKSQPEAAQKVAQIRAKIAALGENATVQQKDRLLSRLGEAQSDLAKIEEQLPKRAFYDTVTGNEVSFPRKLQEMFVDMHTGDVFEQLPKSSALHFADVVAKNKGETVLDALDRHIAGRKFTVDNMPAFSDADSMDLYWRWAEKNFGKDVKLKVNYEEGADNLIFSMDNLPVLQTVTRNQKFDQIMVEVGGEEVLMTKPEVDNLLKAAKDRTAKSLAESGEMTAEEISRSIDVSPKALEQGQGWMTDEVMYWRDNLRSAGLDPDMPKYIRTVKDVTFVQSPMVTDAEIVLRSEMKIAQIRAKNAFTGVFGEQEADKFVDFREAVAREATRTGVSPGLVTAASGDHLSLEAFCQYTGSQTHRLRTQAVEETVARVGAAANNLANHPEVAVKFSTINAKTMATKDAYKLHEIDGVAGLVNVQYLKYLEAVDIAAQKGIPKEAIDITKFVQEGAEHFISFEGDQILEAAVRSHIDSIQSLIGRTGSLKEARGVQHMQAKPGYWSPIRPDPQDFPHHALVVDKTLTGAGRVRMIQAENPHDLQRLTDGVDRSRYDVVFKSETEKYHKAVGDYDYDQTLHQSFWDATKKSEGKAAPFYPLTDPQAISRNFVNYHKKQTDHMVREGVKTLYAQEMLEFERMGLAFEQAGTSRFRGFGKFGAEKEVVNPYQSYAKTMLDMTQKEKMPTYFGIQDTVDQAFSKMWRKIEEINPFAKGDKGIDEAYRTMTEAGYDTGYLGAAEGMYDIINKQAAKGTLSKFIRTVNVTLGNLLLRSDMMNAVNNFIGSNILEGPELSALIRKIEAKSGRVGVLAEMDLKAPTGDAIRSASKLILEGRTKSIIKDEASKAFEAELTARGILPDYGKLVSGLIDDMTLTGAETDAMLGGRMASIANAAKWLGEKAEKVTGNKFAEYSNRFTSAWTAKRITDEAVKQGIISPKEAWVVINTHVNRIHGNIIASQRPLLFQGGIGQAFGLFQSYQFNLLQQLFRNVAEGEKKTALMAMGMQGTMYGLHGMPGFDFVNTYLIGQAAGNTEHRDIYSSTYDAVGKDVGEWLLYGTPSAVSHMALYTRGDINPRHPTIIPLNPFELPQWQIPAKVLGNLKDTFLSLGDGEGNAWKEILRGVERNGVSRPLAGLGAILQGYTTTGQGNISYAGPESYAADMSTLTHLARLTGGKPMQEAVINDAMFRKDTYAAADAKARKEIGEKLKIGMIGEKMPDAEQLSGFMEEYVKHGGKQQNFARWAGQLYRNANEAEANAFSNNLNNRYSRQMQEFMGGERPDFWQE